ncbi:MAG: helix-turn-helix domain-containing protein [Pelagimonas sp.]|uniref:helix-turn-helix domain-containing protein n=1 Tax=Pelagimonas sp. TaxID=2073170 RepID=UPI003D6AB95C
MIGRKSQDTPELAEEAPQSFDDFALQLGDVMRGERATLGKSLLDVQRELRIKASYIAAIENCDPTAFDTPGFIAGYVRSYARYLGMDPDEAFDTFCQESGFSVAHGMSDKASVVKKSEDSALRPRTRDPLAEPTMAYAPVGDSVLSRIEPGAIGSSLVLIALIAGIGYGGWTVLQEVQRVQVTPVDQTPVVLSELDPIDAAGTARAVPTPTSDGPTIVAAAPDGAGVFTPPSSEAFDRLYRPQALDVPVLVARDAPISTLDPETVGVFSEMARSDLPQVQDSSLAAAALAQGLAAHPGQTAVGTAHNPAVSGQGVTVVAARPAWVQVKDEAGAVLYSGILNAGDTYVVPRDAATPRMQIGESGAVYFAVNGTSFGPAGPNGTVTENVSLQAQDLMARYTPVKAGADADLETVLVELDVKSRSAAPVFAAAATPTIPKVLADPLPGITIVATREAWILVKSPSGTRIHETILKPGQSYRVPQTEQPPTIRTGDAGAIYFAVNGQTFGPYGGNGAIADNLALSASNVSSKMAVADLTQNPTLAKVVAELSLSQN